MITVFSLQIDHQQQIQQQLIQNMLTYSQNDPQLMAKLLALLQDKDTENETVRLNLYLFYNLKHHTGSLHMHITASLCICN